MVKTLYRRVLNGAKEELITQPRRKLNFSFQLTVGTIITPLLLFYLELGLVCTKIDSFVEYNPVKCFDFMQFAVNARRQREVNPNSSDVAETMKLLANSLYDYQIFDRSRPSIRKYTNAEKTHASVNN